MVISIISFLASLLLVDVKNAQLNARDAKRIADLNNLATAMELYYSDNQVYPNCADSGYPGGCDLINFNGVNGSDIDSSLDGEFMHFLVPKYISKDAIDPLNTLSPPYFYGYAGHDSELVIGSGVKYSYLIGAVLENPNNPALKNSVTVNSPQFNGVPYYAVGMIQ